MPLLHKVSQLLANEAGLNDMAPQFSIVLESREGDYYHFLCTILHYITQGTYGNKFMSKYHQLPYTENETIGQMYIVAIYEAVKNSAMHGNLMDVNKHIKLSVWYGLNGILTAISDEGSFYTDALNKYLIENRQEVKHKENGMDHWGHGMYLIYKADEIFVDNDQNTLFFFFSINQIFKELYEKYYPDSLTLTP